MTYLLLTVEERTSGLHAVDCQFQVGPGTFSHGQHVAQTPLVSFASSPIEHGVSVSGFLACFRLANHLKTYIVGLEVPLLALANRGMGRFKARSLLPQRLCQFQVVSGQLAWSTIANRLKTYISGLEVLLPAVANRGMSRF